MKCNECLKKDYCTYIHHFNHDPNVGCIEFQDKDYKTYISNTLNIKENKMSKKLTPLQALEDLISFIGSGFVADTHELCEYVAKRKEIIETALKNYEELTSKPVILCERTHGHAQALIDMISKNYKNIKITNLEDNKKLKAFEIIKKKRVFIGELLQSDSLEEYNDYVEEQGRYDEDKLTQEEYDLLKEALK